jgi:hypothetical protein
MARYTDPTRITFYNLLVTLSHKIALISAQASDSDTFYHFRHLQRKVIKLLYLLSVSRAFIYSLRLTLQFISC